MIIGYCDSFLHCRFYPFVCCTPRKSGGRLLWGIHMAMNTPKSCGALCKPYTLSCAGVAANLYIREYVSMGIDSLRFHSESIPMGTF